MEFNITAIDYCKYCDFTKYCQSDQQMVLIFSIIIVYLFFIDYILNTYSNTKINLFVFTLIPAVFFLGLVTNSLALPIIIIGLLLAFKFEEIKNLLKDFVAYCQNQTVS